MAANSSSLLPADFTLGAFKRVLGLGTTAEAIAQGGSGATVNFWLYLRNSLVVATTRTVGSHGVPLRGQLVHGRGGFARKFRLALGKDPA